MTTSVDERALVESRALEIVTTLLAVRAAMSWTIDLGTIHSVTTPTGIGTLVDLSPLYGTVVPWSIFAGIVVSLLVGVTGWSRHAYFVAVALLHLQFCLRFVHGKVPHTEHLLGLVLLGFGVAHVVTRDPVRFRRLSLEYATGALVALYFLAAVTKLAVTGPSWVDGANLALWISRKHLDVFSASGIEPHGYLADLALRSRLVGTSILSAGLLIELASPLAFVERFRRRMLLLFMGLHVGISLTLHIHFVNCLAILLTMAFAWEVHRYASRIRSIWGAGARSPG